ncbi:MAG: hypothetical protein ACPLGZ_03240, partial [Candidatus Pelagibacter ubique]
MAITYLKKSPKTSSTDDTKTTGIVQDLLKNIETTKEQGCIDLTKKFDKYDGDIIVSKERIEEIKKTLDQKTNNRQRREYIIQTMLDNGAISTEEYDAAMHEELIFVGYNKVNSSGITESNVTSSFYDAAINEAIEIMADVLGISEDKAEEQLKSGGYNIYTTEDIAIQTEMEEKFKDQSTFTWRDLEEEKRPQAAGIIMDYRGNVLGVVGQIGEKTESRSLNRATDTTRPPGSTIKPIASYGPAIMYDKITWSTVFKDEPLTIFDFSTGENYVGPKNYSTSASADAAGNW